MLPINFVIRFPTQLWSRADFKLEQSRFEFHTGTTQTNQKRTGNQGKTPNRAQVQSFASRSLCPLFWSESSVSIKSQGSFTEAQNQAPNTESHVGQFQHHAVQYLRFQTPLIRSRHKRLGQGGTLSTRQLTTFEVHLSGKVVRGQLLKS